MKPHNEVVCCVVDFGMVGVPMAERLARKPNGFKKVYLFQEWEEDYSTLNKAIQGDGFQEFERTSDFWSIIDEVDLFVFPDVQRSGLQLQLVKLGKKVWGSRSGDSLELDRELHLRTLKEVGLRVPPFHVCDGLNSLREYLRDKEDQYLKVSLYRGSFETCHFRSWKLDECLLDLFAVRFGPAKELIRFLVFPNIETPLEIGADTYSVDGQWPDKFLHGVEWKDRAYFAAVQKTSEAPEPLREVMRKYGPVLGQHQYRNQFSCEVRVKGKEFYFIDPTCRMGLPSTASQLEVWDNWPEIVWHGANGELVQPVQKGKYTAEAIITAKKDPSEWAIFDVAKDLRQWTKFASCFEYEGSVCFPAIDSPGGDDVGWLVAIGNTPEETIKALNKHADDLPDGMDANTECLAYVLKEIAVEQKAGIQFGSGHNVKMPNPGFVMET